MQINFTGHQLEATDALKEHTISKLDKLKKFDKINNIHITFHVENLAQIAEAKLTIPGHEIHARQESEDMYHSIDGMVEKLNRQLVKLKEKQKDH